MLQTKFQFKKYTVFKGISFNLISFVIAFNDEEDDYIIVLA